MRIYVDGQLVASEQRALHIYNISFRSYRKHPLLTYPHRCFDKSKWALKITEHWVTQLAVAPQAGRAVVIMSGVVIGE